MIHFQLFGFPVAVHWMFWVITALLGGAGSANSPEELQSLVIWIAAAFISILWHELGHAWVMRHFGDRGVRITLYGGGGLAMGRAWRSRREQIIISFAGPLAGLLLGGLVFLLATGIDLEAQPWQLRDAVHSLLWINIIWSLVNLLPVIPLDGGRISEAVLANRGRLALQISLVCAAAFAGYAFFQWGSIFVGLMFAAMAVDNWRSLQGQPPIGWMGGA